ncbi:198_t:CDS:2, partial [Scutellospora calospora]
MSTRILFGCLRVLKSNKNFTNVALRSALRRRPTGLDSDIRLFESLLKPKKYEDISAMEAEQEVFEEDSLKNVAKEEYVPARFDEITEILPKTQRALREEFRYVTMSKVQDAVLSQAPIEGDLFVKAKTGTGKTLAFLIPAIETMNRKSKNNDGRMVSIMILSPTRELAQQIATEAERLTRFYNYKVHCLVGGEKRDIQIRKLTRYRADIVV